MRLSRSLLACLALLGISSAAFAAPIPWSQPSGSVPGVFSWSNGQSDNGFFGSPIVAGNSFTFFPANFRAVSSNAVADTITDRLSFVIEVAPNNPFPLERIIVNELGDYAITNGGQVSADSALFVTNLDIPVNPPNNPLTGSGSFDRNLLSPPGSDAGIWNIQINRDFPTTPDGWRRVQVILNNTLQAASVPGGTALIEKKVAGITITLVIPEPASTSLLAGLSTLAIRRRK